MQTAQVSLRIIVHVGFMDTKKESLNMFNRLTHDPNILEIFDHHIHCCIYGTASKTAIDLLQHIRSGERNEVLS